MQTIECFVMFSEALKLQQDNNNIMASLKPKELVTLLNIIEEDLVEKNSLEKWASNRLNEKNSITKELLSVYAADYIRISRGLTTSR